MATKEHLLQHQVTSLQSCGWECCLYQEDTFLIVVVAVVVVLSGVAESPLMTWGEIESTPFRLDGSDSPYVERNHGPSFRVLATL